MKYKIELPFATIYRDKKISPSMIAAAKESVRINKKFFSLKKKFNIYICDDETSFGKLSRLKDSSYAIGCVQREGDVVIRSPLEMSKFKYTKKSIFPKIMTHEVNHVFWTQNMDGWKPHWLSEGIANVAAKSFFWPKNHPNKISDYNYNHQILDYRYMEKRSSKDIHMKYRIWTAFTQYLIKKYGLKKIQLFLKSYAKNPRLDNYNQLGKRMFKATYKELFEDFLKKN